MFKSLSNFFSLKSPVSRTSNANENDVLKTKKALNATGHYTMPDYGVTPWPDTKMFEGLESFQKQNGLKVDGVMKPSGPTARALGDTLSDNGVKPDNSARDSAAVPVLTPWPSSPSAPRSPEKTPANTPKNKPVVDAKLWWRSNQAPKANSADVSDNARAVATLVTTANNGEHPRWIAEGIASGDKAAVAKLGDLLQQLEKSDPARAKSYNDDVMNRLPADKVQMIAEMFVADKAPNPKSRNGGGQAEAPEPKTKTKASKNTKGEIPDATESRPRQGDYVNRLREGETEGVFMEIQAKMMKSELDFEKLPREARDAYGAWSRKKYSLLGFNPNPSRQDTRRKDQHALEAGQNAAASSFMLEALSEPAKRALLDFEEGVKGLFSKPSTVEEYKAKVKAIESQVPEAYRNTAEFHNTRGHAETVGVAVDIATALSGKKAIQVGVAGANAFKKAGMVSNSLAEAGFSRQAQQAGAALAAAATLGGGPVLNILQKGGIAKLDKAFPKLTGALRDMTPAQAEALAGALNNVGIDLGVDAVVVRAVDNKRTELK